jgi:hypothetical protein
MGGRCVAVLSISLAVGSGKKAAGWLGIGLIVSSQVMNLPRHQREPMFFIYAEMMGRVTVERFQSRERV